MDILISINIRIPISLLEPIPSTTYQPYQFRIIPHNLCTIPTFLKSPKIYFRQFEFETVLLVTQSYQQSYNVLHEYFEYIYIFCLNVLRIYFNLFDVKFRDYCFGNWNLHVKPGNYKYNLILDPLFLSPIIVLN